MRHPLLLIAALVFPLLPACDRREGVTVRDEPHEAPALPEAGPAQAAPAIHEVAPRNTIYQWQIGDAQAVDAALKSAKHVTRLDLVNNRLVPNAIEPRAAIGDYDAGSRRRRR